MIPAGHVVAKDQLVINGYKAPEMKFENITESNQPVIVPQADDKNRNRLVITGENFNIQFDKANGYLSAYTVNGLDMIKEGEALTPNFWRAPTDNDFGAGLQRRYAAWKNPGIKLLSMKHETVDGKVVVSADYEMKEVSAKLALTYTINNQGAIKVTQKMTADKAAKVSNMFRFGMQLVMPKSFEQISYYGRGPVENYSDRNHSTDLGIYNQTVSEQFYAYVRPQEMVTRQTFAGGNN